MKKSLFVLLALVMAFSMCSLAGALELDVTEAATDVAAANADLSAVTVAPGINVLTGDTSLATFDTLPEAIIGTNGALEAYEVAELDGENVLKWTTAVASGTSYPRMSIAMPIEIGRKYYYKFDAKMTGTNTADKVCWLMYDSANILANAYNADYMEAMASGEWITVEGGSKVATKATTELGFQTKTEGTTADDVCYYYYDNMGIYPMYKITYTGLGDEFILFDDQGEVLTSFSPNPEIIPEWTANDGQLVKFIGWSLLPDSTTADETIELNNADVTLYPIWEKRACLSSTWYMSGALGTTFSITAAEAVEWSVDVGNSEATYAVTDNKLTITAAGYPGVVTVTATSADGFVATKVIDVVGGGNYKPGLNMMTGTEELLDFESKPTGGLSGTPNQYNFYFAGVNGASIVANPYTDYTGNDSNVMLQMTLNATTAESYPKLIFKTPMEAGRPYHITTKIATAMGGQYLWLNGNVNLAYGGSLNTTAANKKWYTLNKVYTGGGEENLTFQYKHLNTQLINHVDDMAVYPYYKITYIGIDGQTSYTEYVLMDASGALLDEYTPSLANATGANKLAYDAAGTQLIEGNIPLNYSDITIYGIKTNDVTFIVDGVEKAINATEGDYTIGTPADLGFEDVENFLVWVDQDGEKYKAGEVYAMSEIAGKNFTAFCQDVTKPAVGYSFEGDKIAAGGAAKYSYQEAMEDDGRSVLHAHQYGSGWTASSSSYATDPRIYLYDAEQAFDANEYNIVQYVAKMENGLRPKNEYASTAPENMPAEGLGVQEGTQTIIFYYPESGTNSYWQNYGECRVGGAHEPNPMDGVYRTIEVDMSIASNSNTNGGEWKDRTIYGFAIDANKWATFGADVYVDYIRVYRDGVFTVTYDTNAPADATVTSEVAADTGRGAGTGYLLKGEKPVVEGYTFVGWATKPDATRAEVVEAIDLVGDATVYAVWQKTSDVKNPVIAGTELATKGEDTGIRFKTSITTVDKALVDEIGFIGTLESLLPLVSSVPDYSALTFGLKADGIKSAEDAKLYVTGVAYNKAEGIDILCDETTDGLIYSVFCKGIPEDKGDEVIVVKPYIQLEINGNGVTFYGEAMTTTLNTLK